MGVLEHINLLYKADPNREANLKLLCALKQHRMTNCCFYFNYYCYFKCVLNLLYFTAGLASEIDNYKNNILPKLGPEEEAHLKAPVFSFI